MSCTCILYMEPPGGEPYHRGYKFPAVLIVSGDVILAMTRGTRASVDHINHLSVVNTCYVVVGSGVEWKSLATRLNRRGI